MPVVNSGDLVRDAFARGFAVPAINTQGGVYELVRAVMETAAEERSPIILMAYEANTEFYGLEWLPFLVRRLATEYDVMVGVHLDHGQSVEMANRAVDCGYTSVMLDRSTAALADNISGTNEVIAHAHARGVAVEAEIGELLRNAGSTGVASSEGAANLVDPADVRRFLSECPVDMLAVGIGNAHGFYSGEPNIRLDLLRQVRAVSADTPLVLHGSTGIPEDIVHECISNGMAKINYGTLIRTQMLKHLTGALNGELDHRGHIWRVNQYVHNRLKEDVRPLLRMSHSINRL